MGLFYNLLVYDQLDYKSACFDPKVRFCVLLNLYFKTNFNIGPHFHGPVGGLKIEGLLYMAFTWGPPEVLEAKFRVMVG